MRKRKIHQELFDSLISDRLQEFTVSELKTAYMALPNCIHNTDKAAWQFVYRQVLRMEKKGLLGRLPDLQGDKARYRLTADFANGSAHRIDSTIDQGAELPTDPTLRCLKAKLHNYKEEMLSVIGETEEYESICTQLPHMKNAVQTLYNEARERCSKILGRVRALESILSNHVAAQR